MAALAVLAAAAAAVSWDAQYVLVASVKHNAPIAALEAGIPDVGAVIFAALGIALALHGRHALRPRVLNLACIAISLVMNALASAPGWHDLAIWVMPAGTYALASDTLIGVVRSWVIATARTAVSAEYEATPLAVLGGVLLWLLRLVLAPRSTLGGLRYWVLAECPVAPGPRAVAGTAAVKSRDSLPQLRTSKSAASVRGRRPGKQARMIALAHERHDLATIPLKRVSEIANAIADEISLSPGTARRVLLAHVRAVQANHRQEAAL